MIPAIIGGLAAIAVAVLTYLSQTRGPRHERDLMMQEIELFERLRQVKDSPGATNAASNLSEVIEQRSVEWKWASQETGRLIKVWARTFFMGMGLVYFGGLVGIAGPEYPALQRLSNLLFVVGGGSSISGAIGTSWYLSRDYRSGRKKARQQKKTAKRRVK